MNRGLSELIRNGELRRIYEKWGLWNAATEVAFSKQEAGTALDDFSSSVTRRTTWRERLRQYLSYIPILVGVGAPMTLLISILSMVVAVLFGLTLALLALYGPWPLPLLSASKARKTVRGASQSCRNWRALRWVPSEQVAL